MDTETCKYFECLVCGFFAVWAVGDSGAYSNGVGKPAVIEIMDDLVCYTCEMELKHLDEGGDGNGHDGSGGGGNKANAENKETEMAAEEEVEG